MAAQAEAEDVKATTTTDTVEEAAVDESRPKTNEPAEQPDAAEANQEAYKWWRIPDGNGQSDEAGAWQEAAQDTRQAQMRQSA